MVVEYADRLEHAVNILVILQVACAAFSCWLTPVTYLCKLLGFTRLSPSCNSNYLEYIHLLSSAHFTVRRYLEHLMIKLSERGVFLASNNEIIAEEHFTGEIKKEEAQKGTIAWSILSSHNTSGNMDKLKIKFDSLASHDITFVGIVQTAKASGMGKCFPLPYVLTNCHNSLCAVGGTINGDDHVFGLSAAQRYGGIFVPPHIAVIHQYMREMMAGGGKMILGSDSHTRYGALGTMAVGEGGGELVKQLLNDTWDIDYPGVVAVHLT
ncbi:aconitase family protein [Escherichia coli]